MMKTTMKLLAIVLLVLPQTMQGQNYEGIIDKAFDKVLGTKGISYSTIRDEHRETTGGVEEKTVIYNITVGRANFKLFDELKDAFLAEEDCKTSVYTCFGPLEDSYRQQWAVKLKRGGDFRVGQKSGSSYAIATFDDPKRQGYRLIYTAEWWDTEDKDIRKGVLLASYGEKPAMHSYSASAEWGGKSALDLLGKDPKWATAEINIPDVQQYMNQVDSIMTTRFPDNSVDFAYNPQEWARQAMKNPANLNRTDWMRLFGMLTQKMLDRADTESTEDLVVAAGILLDMCEDTVDLDKDEKDICAARLKDVATQLQSRSQYVYDLLMLAAKRLQKK